MDLLGLNTTNVIIAKADCQLELRYILAIFSSRLINEYFHAFFVDNHIATQYVLSVPVYAINFTTPAVERQRYSERARQLCRESRANNDHASLHSFVTRHLSTSRSDVVHDLLAHLAERMIEMHREKQGHQQGFLLDLGGYLDERQMKKLNRLYIPKKAPKEGLKNYDSRLATYQEAVQLAAAQLGPLAGETLNLEEFWRLSQGQWMWLLRQNLGDLAGMGALVGLYDEYRGRLAPLMRTIQHTDWLIDQTV